MSANAKTIAFAAALWCVLLVPSLGADAPANVGMLDALVKSGDLAEATALARQLDRDVADTVDLTMPLARLADSLRISGDLEQAAEFFERSIAAIGRPPAAQLLPERVVVVRLAAANVYAATQRFKAAIDTVQPVLGAKGIVTEQQRHMAVTLLLRVGGGALATGAARIAQDAYSLASQHADQHQLPKAMLGDAWAVAVEGKDPEQAARRLAQFIDKYPEHQDAARAARACAECLKQAGRTEDASAMLTDLLSRWPESDAAFEVVQNHALLNVDEIPPRVGEWVIQRAASGAVGNWDPATTALGMLLAARGGANRAWTNLAHHLTKIDQSGQATSDLLVALENAGQAADAERLGAWWIADDRDDAHVSAQAREAACRWAGRTQRWSMLAFAAKSERVDQPADSRSVAVERLFAEALTQTGQTAEALTWWSYLVDERAATDFATLLRCAESETSAGQNIDLATERIQAARAAASDSDFSLALVDLLDAELSIRRLEFDGARGLLEHVVRTGQIDAALRGRAQFLIGETHYLQHHFAEAIEAYRIVEGIDPGGIWISASLVQAGKSFEQLGRTREAAVCYGHLLGRFADSSHAAIARRRLARISPDDSNSNGNGPDANAPNDSRSTIRR